MRHRRMLTAVLFVLCGVVPAAQDTRRLSIDVIYDPDKRVTFSGTPPPDITWLDADTYLVPPRQGRGTEWLRIEARTGNSSPLFEPSRLESAIAALPGVTKEEAALLARAGDVTFNPSHTALLLTLNDDLYLYELASAKATRLTNAAGAEEEALFSPDGRHVAYVRANNLFVVAVATQKEVALTSDGNRELLNGKLDWLYQEEIYGRGRFRGFWWSGDSARVAFLQLDERPVPEYTVVDHIPYRAALEVTDYPKAGDPNPLVKLGIARADGGSAPVWADLGRYSNTEILIVNVGWTPDSRAVVHQVQDREQTWLDLNLADAASGQARRVLRETTQAWVSENGNPHWLKDGSFLWLSERSGFKHLYRYRTDGTAVQQVTNGRWEVRAVYGVDERSGIVYFTAPERSPLDTDVYRVGLDGRGFARVSQAPGTHRAIFNPTFTQYVDVWSDANTPAQARLHRADGTEIRLIEANPVRALAEYSLSRPEFIQVPARDGFVMDAMMIKPPDFDPSRRYPVYQFTYAGPGAAQVRNQWGGSQYMFHQLLAQHGIIVWVLDNRSASGKGAESQWQVYGRLGEQELEDLEDGVAWLKKQSFVDPTRLLLSGWSYGGFMTAYALTHSTSWSAGIVGAPVTDWRDYDTIYTERYMKTPQRNPDGYTKTAPRFAADKLHGRMLLIHGAMDDNVHMQNSVQFAYELQKARKPFEMMLYAKSRHGIEDPRLNTHLRHLMLDFVLRTIGTTSTTPQSAAR